VSAFVLSVFALSAFVLSAFVLSAFTLSAFVLSAFLLSAFVLSAFVLLHVTENRELLKGFSINLVYSFTVICQQIPVFVRAV
jgi:hypothetical protein